MSCKPRRQAWKRAWSSVVTPRAAILAALGVALFVTGVVTRSNTLRLPLLVLGVGVLVLGVLLPVASEAEVGPEGFKFKRLVEERDAEFEPFAHAQKDSLQRFALLLSGDSARSTALAEEALARTYVDWHSLSGQDAASHSLCVLVRVFLGSNLLGMLGQARSGDATATVALPQETIWTLDVLSSLSPRCRAILLLRHYWDLDEGDIAVLVNVRVETVRSELHQAEAEATRLFQTPSGAP